MGWKSTIDIKRSEAVELITREMLKIQGLDNYKLGNALESMGFGEDNDKPYFGRNFNVIDDEDYKEPEY